MHSQLIKATTPDKRIQHDTTYLWGNKLPTFILQENYPLLECTQFWYGTENTLVRHRYAVAGFRIKYKNLN
jgi:hypothetical protein